jgi:hypothetical protein
MNWLRQLSGGRRANSGMEWWLWRRLLVIGVIGTLLPLLILGLLYFLKDTNPSEQTTKMLQMAGFACLGAIIFNWTMILTLGIGCVVVMIMKGPGYVADGYWVSHSDQPRQEMESAQQAKERRQGNSVN